CGATGRQFPPVRVARLCEPVASLHLLDRIVGQGFYCSSILMRDPWMDSIRGRSRFAEVVRRADERTREAHDEFIRLDGHRLLALNAWPARFSAALRNISHADGLRSKDTGVFLRIFKAISGAQSLQSNQPR